MAVSVCIQLSVCVHMCICSSFRQGTVKEGLGDEYLHIERTGHLNIITPSMSAFLL